MISLALLWHQHQPLYNDPAHPTPEGSYREPWVRLHALRDYYSMAALVAEHPGVHLTINLTPALLWQIEDYTERGATDQSLELTRTPVSSLGQDQQDEILSSFFDADWHHQIFPHPRYKELFEQRTDGRSFTKQDLRDLQMWFNLAWFGREFRESEVELVTGETVSVLRFAEKGRGFCREDIHAMIEEQHKLMRAVIPLHRTLQDRGQIEVCTTPFYHPILPLLIDTDQATVDRPGAALPERFAYPEDAEAQVGHAVEKYKEWFGRAPRGMWPAEGAVSQSSIPFFAEHDVSWIATDQGVLERSGRWGYEIDDPNVLCRPYRAEVDGSQVSIFFRDTVLSDAIGFHYHGFPDYGEAARNFLHRMKAHCARHDSDDQVHTVILDGENAWGAYREDARPFLHALYGQLEEDTEIRTVTFSEYLEGNKSRDLPPHPVDRQEKIYDLYTGSWIDEMGSAPGVDLGTWIGEPEENRAWELLLAAREALDRAEATPTSHPEAFQALYRAEGSDWFWWFGQDQDSGNDAAFDDLFRMHLKNVYRGLGLDPPPDLDRPIVPRDVIWTFTNPVDRVAPGNRLVVQTNCPGELTWWLDEEEARTEALSPVGGVMAGVHRYHSILGPFEDGSGPLHFRFRCTHRDCDGKGLCCREDEQSFESSNSFCATMGIAVFGGTGGTGNQFVAQATGAGHQLRALTRSPEKLSGRDAVTPVEGNVLDPESVGQTVKGTDAAVCILGRTKNNPADVVSRGTAHILNAMQQHDVRRLVVVTSIGLGASVRNLPWYGRLANATVLQELMADKARQEELVMRSRLDWTIVRPGGLTDGPRTREYVHGTNVDVEAAPIARADVADFLLRVLERNLYVREVPLVTTREGVDLGFLWQQVRDVTARLLWGR